jgi:DNA modification methylase
MRALKKRAVGNVVPFAKPAEFFIECQDNLRFMRGLPDESMQLIVTSPPYNLGKEYEKLQSLLNRHPGMGPKRSHPFW